MEENIVDEVSFNNGAVDSNSQGRSIPSLSSLDLMSNVLLGDQSFVQQKLVGDGSELPIVKIADFCVNTGTKSPPLEYEHVDAGVNKETVPEHSSNDISSELPDAENRKIDCSVKDCVSEIILQILHGQSEAVDSGPDVPHNKVDSVSQSHDSPRTNSPLQCDNIEITKCEPEQCIEQLKTVPGDTSKEENVPQTCQVGNVIPNYEFEGDIQMVTGAWSEFDKSSEDCFTKGCKWAPDGTCILTNSDDNILRIFDLPAELHCQNSWSLGRTLPEIAPSLKIPVGGQIYDYCWYPLMSSYDPLSCCLVSASQNCPIHLWNAYDGKIRCTYRPYNSVDEIEHAYSVAFSPSGDKLYCGFRNNVRVFDTSNPGRDCIFRNLKGCGRVLNIISTICVNPAVEKLYAVGSYSKTIALCSEPEGKVLCLFCGQRGAVTHLGFSPDGTKLYAGCRKDSQILCWDMRNLGTVLYTLEREVNNHQRIYFDISTNGRYLMSGGTNGKVKVWDILQSPVPTAASHPDLPALNKFQASVDCVNGISLHQQYPILATSSGQRHCREVDEGSDDDAIIPLIKKTRIQRENGLKFWWLGRISLPKT